MLVQQVEEASSKQANKTYKNQSWTNRILPGSCYAEHDYLELGRSGGPEHIVYLLSNVDMAIRDDVTPTESAGLIEFLNRLKSEPLRQ